MSENDVAKEIERLEQLRIFPILLSFVAGIFLIRMGHLRAAILTVGVVMTVCSVGYIFLRKAVLRSFAAKTGKTVAQAYPRTQKQTCCTRSKTEKRIKP